MYSTSADGEVESVVLLSVEELVGRGVVIEEEGFLEVLVGRGVVSGMDDFVEELVGRDLISGVDGSMEAVEVVGLDVVVEESWVEDMIVDEICIFGSLVVERGRTVEGDTFVSAFVFVDMISFKIRVELGVYDDERGV